jgi:hypothetical protein
MAPPARQALRALQQRIEHRRAVEARHAAPDDARRAVDQRAHGAVADQGQVQRCGPAGIEGRAAVDMKETFRAMNAGRKMVPALHLYKYTRKPDAASKVFPS